mmetsp:Transcript_16779/g.23564  ORF Transcript_16779/g.23564 Transcript_16779/m.23564 type:complete len:120 (-) Transcript_16779:107-466(-)
MLKFALSLAIPSVVVEKTHDRKNSNSPTSRRIHSYEDLVKHQKVTPKEVIANQGFYEDEDQQMTKKYNKGVKIQTIPGMSAYINNRPRTFSEELEFEGRAQADSIDANISKVGSMSNGL